MFVQYKYECRNFEFNEKLSDLVMGVSFERQEESGRERSAERPPAARRVLDCDITTSSSSSSSSFLTTDVRGVCG